MSNENILSLDVRPIIAKGNDPFKEIMETVNKLSNKQTLEIINSFMLKLLLYAGVTKLDSDDLQFYNYSHLST